MLYRVLPDASLMFPVHSDETRTTPRIRQPILPRRTPRRRLRPTIISPTPLTRLRFLSKPATPTGSHALNSHTNRCPPDLRNPRCRDRSFPCQVGTSASHAEPD
jgi:hypothetical protein